MCASDCGTTGKRNVEGWHRWVIFELSAYWGLATNSLFSRGF